MKPTRLDRLVGYFSPQAFNERLAARYRYQAAQKRYLEAGSRRPRMSRKFAKAHSGFEQDIVSFLTTIRQRTEFLDDNMPYARRASNLWSNFVVGNGIRPDFKGDDKKKSQRLEEAWREWAESTNCDLYGTSNLYGLMALAYKTQFISGSCYIVRRWVKGSKIPLQLQLLGPDKLDMSKEKSGSNTVTLGIERTSAGKKVAFWFKQTTRDGREKSVRIAAADVAHVFEVLRPGQLTGIPRLTPCVVRISEYDDYTDAALVKQKIAACLVGAIHDMQAEETFAGVESDSGVDELPQTLSPGTWTVLPRGKTVEFNNPPTTEGVSEYESTQLRAIASGSDLPYEMLSNDYTRMNFSSSRMSLGTFYQVAEPLRRNQFIPQFCDRVLQWFKEAAELKGIATDCRCEWSELVKLYPDPYKEAMAAKINVVDLGVETRSSLIKSKGKDPDLVFEQLKVEKEMFGNDTKSDS